MIKQIDVIKGPISALYVHPNRAGAVNIETLDGGNVASNVAVDVASFGGRRANIVLGGDYNGFESLFVADQYRTKATAKPPKPMAIITFGS